MFYRSILFFLFFNYSCLSIAPDYDALHQYITDKYLFHETMPMQPYIDSKPYENFMTECSLNLMLKQLIKDFYSDEDPLRKKQAQQYIENFADTFKLRVQELSVLHTTRSQLQRSDIAILGEIYGEICITIFLARVGIHYDNQVHRFKSKIAFAATFSSLAFLIGRLCYNVWYQEKHQCGFIHLLNLINCQIITTRFATFFRSLLAQQHNQEQQESTASQIDQEIITTTDQDSQNISMHEKTEVVI